MSEMDKPLGLTTETVTIEHIELVAKKLLKYKTERIDGLLRCFSDEDTYCYIKSALIFRLTDNGFKNNTKLLNISTYIKTKSDIDFADKILVVNEINNHKLCSFRLHVDSDDDIAFSLVVPIEGIVTIKVLVVYLMQLQLMMSADFINHRAKEVDIQDIMEVE